MSVLCGVALFGHSAGLPGNNRLEIERMVTAGAFLGPEHGLVDVWEAPNHWCAVRYPAYKCGKHVAHSHNVTVAFDGNMGALSQSQGNSLLARDPAEFVLDTFIKDGPEALEELKGHFSLAVVDGRSGYLYLFRSAFGLRPLVYFWEKHHSRAAWGSTIRQLSVIPEFRSELQEEYLADYLCTTTRGSLRTTPFKNVFHVLPGQCLKITSMGIAEVFNQSIKYIESIGKIPDPLLVEEFRYLFERSVERCLEQTAPTVSVALSGGLDSSAVACIVADVI